MTVTLCAFFLTCSVISQSTPVPDGKAAESEQSRLETSYRDARQKLEQAEEERSDFEQRLKSVRLPMLEDHSGGDIVQFMTDPGTPYLERMAMARRGIDAANAYVAIQAVDAYREFHQALYRGELGMLPHPRSGDFMLIPGETGPRPGSAVKLAGHEWIVPAEPEQWPILLAEKEAARWPWQAWEALQEFIRSVRRKAADPAWHSVIVSEASGCSEQNFDSTERALALLDLVDGHGGVEAIAVLVNIARSPFAAQHHTARAAGMIADFGRRGTDKREAMAWDLAAAYIIRNAAHWQARHAAAQGVCTQYREFRLFPNGRRLPVHSILAAGDRALDDGRWERWNALAGLAAPCMQRLDRWDFRILFDVDPEDTETVQAMFAAFKGLYALERASLVGDARKMPELTAELRRALGFWSEPRTDYGP